MQKGRPRMTAIAARELRLVPSGRPVELEVDAPEQRRGGAWVCAYRVRGLGRVRAGRATGADSLEAVLHAIAALRRELEPFGGRLTWAGEAGELGLPVPVPDFL